MNSDDGAGQWLCRSNARSAWQTSGHAWHRIQRYVRRIIHGTKRKKKSSATRMATSYISARLGLEIGCLTWRLDDETSKILDGNRKATSALHTSAQAVCTGSLSWAKTSRPARPLMVCGKVTSRSPSSPIFHDFTTIWRLPLLNRSLCSTCHSFWRLLIETI